MDTTLQRYLASTSQCEDDEKPLRFSEKDFFGANNDHGGDRAELGGYHLWTRDWENARAYVKGRVEQTTRIWGWRTRSRAF